MILAWCVVVCVVWCGVAYGEQAYVLTSMGNLFVVDGYVTPNGTDALQMVPHEFEGFFLAGGRHNAEVVPFNGTYHIPYVVAADSGSVYAAVRDTYVSSVVPNHGTYLYRNGHLELSTFGLEHVVRSMYGRVFEGAPAWRGGTDYTTFYGGGRAAYTLQHVTHNGKAVDDFLAHMVCYVPPCGSITAAKSHDNLLVFSGTLEQARLYDVVQLGAEPAILSEDHYIIVDTANGTVRLRAAAYDYDTFQIRWMPNGTAYTISGLPAAEWWPAGNISCCRAPPDSVTIYRAGVQTGSDTISYGSDSLAGGQGSRHNIEARTYQDVLWWSGKVEGGRLLFDHVNGMVVRFAGSPDMVVLPGMYARVPAPAGTILSGVSVAEDACGTPPYVRMPYLDGETSPESVLVPAVPGYSVLCVEIDGTMHALPLRGMAGYRAPRMFVGPRHGIAVRPGRGRGAPPLAYGTA
ncbi:MAG: hypothetical protein IS632_09015 [Thaumarchaeota archaeon]|nr:hypothetical protein [Nitrososphaerota archaeon]